MGAIPEVTVEVVFDGEMLTPDSDGYLGLLCPDAEFVVKIGVGPGTWIHGFMVDGKKNVKPAKNHVQNLESGKLYRFKVPFRQGETTGEYSTVYPDNNLRLAQFRVDQPDFLETGAVQLWEVAVVTQHGKLFLTEQATYHVACYEDRGQTVVYPQFGNWPQVNDYLVPLLPPGLTLRRLSSFQPNGHQADTPRNLGDKEGVVQWFNLAQGIGALSTRQGGVLVHWRQVLPRPRRAYLEQGEPVRFTALRKPSSSRTTFKLEAVGVTLQ